MILFGWRETSMEPGRFAFPLFLSAKSFVFVLFLVSFPACLHCTYALHSDTLDFASRYMSFNSISSPYLVPRSLVRLLLYLMCSAYSSSSLFDLHGLRVVLDGSKWKAEVQKCGERIGMTLVGSGAPGAAVRSCLPLLQEPKQHAR